MISLDHLLRSNAFLRVRKDLSSTLKHLLQFKLIIQLGEQIIPSLSVATSDSSISILSFFFETISQLVLYMRSYFLDL